MDRLDVRDAETTYTKATKAELAKDYDLAFSLYVKAAEAYLHLTRSSNHSNKEEIKWKADAGKALERAEKIKAFIERPKYSGRSLGTQGSLSPSSNPIIEPRLTPIAINHFSAQEQRYVLKKGGSMNGLIFPLWDETIGINSQQSTLYCDPDGQPKLSPEQLKVSPVWRRSSNLGLVRDNSFQRAQDILQHVVTDCSVCASISVFLEHGRRFGSNLAESSIYNEGHNGRFDIKIMMNGAWRRIVIDDNLPYDPVDGTLMCMSTVPSNIVNDKGMQRQVLWPSLLEKGYMKLMGGYDFPGSNSSIDLHALAGWIPEHIEIKGSAFERERTWDRIYKGFTKGHCLVTVGTGIRKGLYWKGVRLLESHSYAILDIKEQGEERTFEILDSWVHPSNVTHQQSRFMEIPWSDVLLIFDGIYLNWDPQYWSSSLSFHGMWRRNGETEQSTRQVRLMFDIEGENDTEIWVLLTRHVVNTRRTCDFIALRVEPEDDYLLQAPSLNQQKISAKGTYTNSTHILVRTRIKASQRSGALSLLASYDGDATEIGFTLSAYAMTGTTFKWDETVEPPPFTNRISGILTSKNAGGNCTCPTFMLNPQYYLRIHPSKMARENRAGNVRLTMTLESTKDIPVNVVAVWSQGERVVELAEKELVVSSGAYSYGIARVTKDIGVGDYTVIVSAFELHHLGPFSLKIECSNPFDISSIPQEGAGMYSKTIRGSWDSNSAGGVKRYHKNPVYELEIPSLSQIKIRLQLLNPSNATSLNVTIFPAATANLTSYDQHVATSGAYSDAIAGVATPLLSLRAGKYWVVPSTYSPGIEAEFKLLVHSSTAIITIGRRVAEHVNQGR